MKPLTTITLSILFLLPLTTATTPPSQLSPQPKCFAPDGAPVTSSLYQPCISITGVHSMCCRLNAANPETCDPSGLCISSQTTTTGTGTSGTTTTSYYREFCTDSSWNSTNCLPRNICGDANSGNSNWSYQLTPCGNSLWCCGSSTACCSTGQAFKLNRTLINFPDLQRSLDLSAPTATVTVLPAGENSDGSAGMERESGMSRKAKIGVGIGVPVACLVMGLVGVGGGFVWGRKVAAGGRGRGDGMGGDGESVGMEKPKGSFGSEDDGASTAPCLQVVKSG
ncbi:uncharacterized protein BO80DRAFT_376540 [Aspergillus ibericus CBS 121593]|uniref:Mid2 domain-containing protein n=1 Tax=Aspergillus ibericus CBS 121593 TaxID=1448316 RepID=A0A395H783_9EURO|nr:hypothetical protein BO80DRAFT_376540 [Aspergillus ibericus CBS 121593]RAL03510.1 hypothetical protein BO80DRAFT_376540 [Aspergillus ibericus CBS 121593]